MSENYGGSFELLFFVSELAKLPKEEQRMIDLDQMAKLDAANIHRFVVEIRKKED